MGISYVFVGTLILFGNLLSVAKCEDSGSVIFIDDRSPRFLRPSIGELQDLSMSPAEVGSLVSVLLGFNPPASLSEHSSSKINEVLMPNPFERPRSVLMLEVSGVDDSSLIVNGDNSILKNFFRRKYLLDLEQTRIELPSEEVVVISLDDSTDRNDKDIEEFVSWFGGTYDKDGKLILPLSGGKNMELDVSKEADRKFVLSLLRLSHKFQSSLEMHKSLPHGIRKPAELTTGVYDGLEILQDYRGSDNALQNGLEVFLLTLSKLFTSLQTSYNGNLVGVVLLKKSVHVDSDKLIHVAVGSYPALRQLGETLKSSNTTNVTIEAAALVRSTLAWTTGIILLISTLLGIYLLLSMPLTRDTLLYANVKLD